jgi:hypothetical protein
MLYLLMEIFYLDRETLILSKDHIPIYDVYNLLKELWDVYHGANVNVGSPKGWWSNILGECWAFFLFVFSLYTK